ncbi:heme A synthase [Rhodobacterales bacterium 52_120_T64]|nr:heme A synthase [Rhodobacterales bacterium 52_120_T64]
MARSIFEDVSGEKVDMPAPKAARKSARRAIAGWLMALFALVVLMIVIGGMTRLTDSGLSITEWKPVTGAIPPMGEATWVVEFDKYKATPEYELQNVGMTMDEFKGIFWWEWGHRFLGRFIGMVWFIGFVWFALRRQIPTGWTGKLVSVGALGGLQGAVGWWMVSSGLEGRMVDVASYRLATHLGLAFFILGLIAWFVFELRRETADLLQARRRRESGLMTLGTLLVVVLFVQILLGALVAGIDAGRSFPTWPTMAGEFLPSESFDYQPKWSNFFENPALVQFNHRLLGYAAFLLAGFAWWHSRSSSLAGVQLRFSWMMVMMFGQIVLGIVTVLYAAPVHAAIVHQLGAVVLFVVTLQARFEAAYPVEQKISRG